MTITTIIHDEAILAKLGAAKKDEIFKHIKNSSTFTRYQFSADALKDVFRDAGATGTWAWACKDQFCGHAYPGMLTTREVLEAISVHGRTPRARYGAAQYIEEYDNV